MQSQSDQKRKSVRVPVDLAVIVIKDGKEYSGRVLNLSVDGVFIKTDHLFAENDILDVVLALAGSPDSIHAKAKIIWGTWIEGTNVPTSGIGVSFIGIDESQKQRLQDFIQELLRK